MQCSEWLGQQVVIFDRRGITLHDVIRRVANNDGAHFVNVGRLAVVEGENPSEAARNPEIHILRNATFAGIGYAELVVVEAALYLYERLSGTPHVPDSGECRSFSPEEPGRSRENCEGNGAQGSA